MGAMPVGLEDDGILGLDPVGPRVKVDVVRAARPVTVWTRPRSH